MATECNVVAKRTPLLPAPANDDNPDAAKVDCQTESEASPGSLSQIGWIVAAVSCGVSITHFPIIERYVALKLTYVDLPLCSRQDDHCR